LLQSNSEEIERIFFVQQCRLHCSGISMTYLMVFKRILLGSQHATAGQLINISTFFITSPFASSMLQKPEEIDQPLLQDDSIGYAWDVCKGSRSISLPLWKSMVRWRQRTSWIC
jgi:hypothetical protein